MEVKVDFDACLKEEIDSYCFFLEILRVLMVPSISTSILDVIVALSLQQTSVGTNFLFTSQLGGPGKYFPGLYLSEKRLSCFLTLSLHFNINISLKR